MKTGLKRHISAWLLLAVFVPMLVLTALHTHAVASSVSDECVECVNHQPHSGHLTATTQTLTDCVLCQFRTLPALEAQTTSFSLFIPAVQLHYVLADQPVVCMNVDSLRSRAPPSCI